MTRRDPTRSASAFTLASSSTAALSALVWLACAAAGCSSVPLPPAPTDAGRDLQGAAGHDLAAAADLSSGGSRDLAVPRDLAATPDLTPACKGPSPEGCSRAGCPAGLVCDQNIGCHPSSCSCHMGGWVCTDDCGGGECVKPGRPCPGPNPEGCKNRGCDRGFVCDLRAGCAPSSCTCDPMTGGWACTKDCGGGVCVPAGGGDCPLPSPEGCKNSGCPAGQLCDLNAGCKPSSCKCDPGTKQWACTRDCGGGTCVP